MTVSWTLSTSDAAPEKIGGGFDFTEGPVWHPREKTVVFSDMPGNHMRVWTEAGGVATFRRPSDMANGNAYDLDGRLDHLRARHQPGDAHRA